MKFLVDAHLPRRLALWLQQAGFDALHTLDLPLRNRTPDPVINALSIREQRIVVTKDTDFLDSLMLRQEPWKLLPMTTGNIQNTELFALFEANLEQVVDGFTECDFIEITRTKVFFHF